MKQQVGNRDRIRSPSTSSSEEESLPPDVSSPPVIVTDENSTDDDDGAVANADVPARPSRQRREPEWLREDIWDRE